MANVFLENGSKPYIALILSLFFFPMLSAFLLVGRSSAWFTPMLAAGLLLPLCYAGVVHGISIVKAFRE